MDIEQEARSKAVQRTLELISWVQATREAANAEHNQDLLMLCDYTYDQLNDLLDTHYICGTCDECGQRSVCPRDYCTNQRRIKVMRNLGSNDDQAIYTRIWELAQALLVTPPTEVIHGGMYWGLYCQAAMSQCRVEINTLINGGRLDDAVMYEYA